MPTKHTLFLDIPHTNNPFVIKIMDSSVYGTDLQVDCARLDIYFPGFEIPKYIENLSKNFILNVNAVDLKLQLVDDEYPLRLPDGLYTIRYSVSPNESVYVDYYHLRTTEMMNEYYKVLASITLSDIDENKDIKLDELRNIKLYIEGAKAQAEVTHASKLSIEMLAYADKKLKKFRSTYRCTC
jgi:hypothetical protein